MTMEDAISKWQALMPPRHASTLLQKSILTRMGWWDFAPPSSSTAIFCSPPTTKVCFTFNYVRCRGWRNALEHQSLPYAYPLHWLSLLTTFLQSQMLLCALFTMCIRRKWTHIGLAMSVCPVHPSVRIIKLENCSIDLDETWRGSYAIGVWHKILLFSFLPSYHDETCEVGSTLEPLAYICLKDIARI
jgi:hypothetical protein